MKRTILFALMIPLLLTGCGARRDAENWKAFAETVETAERISFHAEITAHWEDSSASFGADVARAGSETHITLTAPETEAACKKHGGKNIIIGFTKIRDNLY